MYKPSNDESSRYSVEDIFDDLAKAPDFLKQFSPIVKAFNSTVGVAAGCVVGVHKTATGTWVDIRKTSAKSRLAHDLIDEQEKLGKNEIKNYVKTKKDEIQKRGELEREWLEKEAEIKRVEQHEMAKYLRKLKLLETPIIGYYIKVQEYESNFSDNPRVYQTLQAGAWFILELTLKENFGIEVKFDEQGAPVLMLAKVDTPNVKQNSLLTEEVDDD